MRSAVALAALFACRPPAPAPEAASSGPAAAATPARLVVYVVVDQLPQRLLDDVRPILGGGLGRLVGPEAFVATARHAHAITFTCPGHAVLSTGAAPSVSGIPSNDWIVGGERVYCGDAAFLRAETVGDVVKEAGGVVASLSIKDRGAVMMGGRAADRVVWVDLDAGAFVGTDAAALQAAVDPEAYHDRPWTALRPDWYAARVPDARAVEGDPGGLGVVFPHPTVAVAGKKSLRAHPAGGTLLVDAAIATVDQLKLGADERPDLLAVSFSHIDYIGHAYSSESWETMDAMLRLDADLARLFEHLDRTVGAWSVVLSSDHGSAPAGEVTVRVRPDAVQEAADAALAAAKLPTGALFEDPGLWLPDPVRADPAQRARAVAAVTEALEKTPGVGRVYDVAAKDRWPADDPHAEAVRLSIDPERSGDLYVLQAPFSLYDYPGSEGRGTSHGTPYPYDQAVPFLAWGVGVRPGTPTEWADSRHVAPTVCHLLGLRPPADAALPPYAAATR